jgi:transcription-repair coupling factor (superfamily II helicase)
MGASLWEEYSQNLRASESYKRLLESHGSLAGLPLAAAAWVVDLVSEDLGKPVVVVVPREADALVWLEGIKLFGRKPGVFFSAPPLNPYQEGEISLAVRSRDAVALSSLLRRESETLVLTPTALFRKIPPAEEYERSFLSLGVGREYPIESLARQLSNRGYIRADLVSEIGDFAVRGGVVDLYSPGEPWPLRLDMFGDTIESIKYFDPQNQRSQQTVQAVEVLPLSLFLGGEEGGMNGSLTDYLEEALVVVVEPDLLHAEIEAYASHLAEDLLSRVEADLETPLEDLFHPVESVLGTLEGAAFSLGTMSGQGTGFVVDFGATSTDVFHQQLPRFPRELETARARQDRLVIVSLPEHHERVEHLCEVYELPRGSDGVGLVEGDLARGFRLPAARLVVYGEPQLFARVSPRRRRVGARAGAFVSGLRDLKVGDFVVHADHGIGQFVAMRSVRGNSTQALLPESLSGMGQSAVQGDQELMEIAYRDGQVLLLPLQRLDLLQRYGGVEGVEPRLDRLGGTSWIRAKERVKKGLQRLAVDLLRLYAERQLATAPAMPADGDLQAQFEAAFEFEETPDQLEATAAIKADLELERPMDRLLCGDVGFGKTEVAMRAALKVVEGGYQVAILAPTTILADQHLETFRRRFADLPIKIEMISRFRSTAEVKRIRGDLAAGSLDILIGTHRLLGRDIEIPRLGLLVVDEEQRFGVGQKERLRELKKAVHVLAMTATPVPRTLQLSLAGVRDLSLIETAPQDRMAVETVISPYTAEVVKDAIQYELQRGGQIYYVYNRVEGIEEVGARLRELVPNLSLTIGHGQLPENELFERMHRFKDGEYRVLLATTIIENGIDISNVNTMIVHNAERFGLAQLYQLRGRVGRGRQLAFCYLLVTSKGVPNEQARRRLEAIREFSHLGAGFRVAGRDLEIRGAGNLLGPEQSGHIAALGIETYLKLLEDAIHELQGEPIEEAAAVTIDLPVAAAIPEEYIGDMNLRLDVYRQIAAFEGAEEQLAAELRDRFGPPPEAVMDLLGVAGLKRIATDLRVQSISVQAGKLQIKFRRDAIIDVERLIELVSTRPGAGFTPSGVLTLAREGTADWVKTATGILSQFPAGDTGIA